MEIDKSTEELVALQNIFDQDITAFDVALRSEVQEIDAAISLRIKLPPSYPDDVLHHISNYALILKIPSVAVVSVKNVSDSAVEELQEILYNAAQESRGDPMIFTLTSLSQEWINEDHSENATEGDADEDSDDDDDWEWEEFVSVLEENLPHTWGATMKRGEDVADKGGDTTREKLLKQFGKKTKKKLDAKKYTCTEDPENLRAPIICVLGHVDTGKTTLLDSLRSSAVQEGEEGGITQQIGATLIPKAEVESKIATLNSYTNFNILLPGLVFIDTPGHESFSNMRVRGSSLCDFAILTVEITSGLQGQSIESIKLLRKGRTRFVVALNKIDRINGWVTHPHMGFRSSFEKQSEETKEHFHTRLKIVRKELSDYGVNASLYWHCKDLDQQTAIVPMTALHGCGVPDLVLFSSLVCQNVLFPQLVKKEELQCNVLEVHTSRGLGTTCDVLLVNGSLKVGDKIMLCGLNGPVTTTIRSLIVSPEMTELKGKSGKTLADSHVKVATAVQGLKIWAKGLDDIVSGSQLYTVGKKDNLEVLGKIVMRQLDSLKTRVQIGKQGGLRVHASTLGSLEALLEFLNENGVPIGSIGLGTVNPRDVTAVKPDKKGVGNVLLAFDVRVTRQAQNAAVQSGVEIISSGVIYQLLEEFQNRKRRFLREARETGEHPPCILAVNPEFILKEYDPLILGMRLSFGSLNLGTLLFLIDGQCVGSVESIKHAVTGASVPAATLIGETYILQLGTWDTGRRLVFGRDIFEDDRFFTKINYAQFRNAKLQSDKSQKPLLKKYCSFLGFEERDREDSERDRERRERRQAGRR